MQRVARTVSLGAKPDEDIPGLCDALLSGLESALAHELLGVYVHGAAASSDAAATGDIDFHG